MLIDRTILEKFAEKDCVILARVRDDRVLSFYGKLNLDFENETATITTISDDVPMIATVKFSDIVGIRLRRAD